MSMKNCLRDRPYIILYCIAYHRSINKRLTFFFYYFIINVISNLSMVTVINCCIFEVVSTVRGLIN